MIRGRDQVMLKVTVAEVRRDVIKQLGIDLSGTLNYGTAVVNFNTSNPFSANGGPLSETARWYIAAALEDPVMQSWMLAARSETWTVPGYEVGL